MNMFRIHTLQQKTFIFVLIPTFLFLTAVGLGSFIFAKENLLMQWSETADANLQKAAHLVDMRLSRPKDLLQRLKYTSGKGMAHLTLQYTLDQLKKLDGVVAVNFNWPSTSKGMYSMMDSSGGRQNEFLKITTPEYIWQNGTTSVSLLSILENPTTKEKGSIEVFITLSDLVQQISESDWWKNNRTVLIDTEGNIIAHSSNEGVILTEGRQRFGETDSLEIKTLAEIQHKSHGTIFGSGNPPREISGFYQLSDVPWFMTVIAPGDAILHPILKFSFYYMLLFAISIVIIIFFIRSMTTKMTSSIQKISAAAEDLANGTFGPSLPVKTQDEIGELTKNFNTMTEQLKQGMELQKSIEIAREVQQNFLPSTKYTNDGIDIYGFCRYCQETGGDFFDLIHYEKSSEKIGAIVGDVVGHGLGAALLMVSVRAMIRARNDQPGNLADIITDVNAVLCKDTAATSNFVTLFYLVVNTENKTLEWVRAGHDPALVLYPEREESVELNGKGVAIGVEGSLTYESNTLEILPEHQLVVIGSDGAWEAENNKGQRFGKNRIKTILAENSNETPEKIIQLINEELDIFLDDIPPQDDITFIVIKIDGRKVCSSAN